MKRRDPLSILSDGNAEWRKRWLAGLAKAGRAVRVADAFGPFDVTHVLLVLNADMTFSWSGHALLRCKGGWFLFVEIGSADSPAIDRGTLRELVKNEQIGAMLADPDLRRTTRWLRQPFTSMAALAALRGSGDV